jgi:hypothetical protein
MQAAMEGTAQIESSPVPAVPPVSKWNLAALIAFRLVFAYQVLYSFPFPLSFLPKADKIFGWYETLFTKLTVWSGTHILHLQQPVSYTISGSGDSLFSWVQNFTQLWLAVVVVVIWSVADRKRRNYQYLHEWLWLYVRVVLGATLMTYGAAKVIKTQFPDLFLWRLLEPYGDSSPMGLLWTFMGYSKMYNLFTGLVEFAGGALLFVPRLSALGALVSMGAMTQVFILNMSYDVPVKLYSFNLLLMGVFLMSREWRRMLDVFLFNRPAAPVIHPPLFQRRWLNVGLLALQILLLCYFGGTNLYSNQQRFKESGDGSPKPALYGVYSVDEMSVDGQARPPLFTDATRWRRMIFDRYTSIGLFPAEGPVQRYSGKLDEAKKTLELTRRGDKTWKASFTLDRPSPTIITLNGEMDGKKIQAKLRLLDVKTFPLNKRGFHWINEFPFNR